MRSSGHVRGMVRDTMELLSFIIMLGVFVDFRELVSYIWFRRYPRLTGKSHCAYLGTSILANDNGEIRTVTGSLIKAEGLTTKTHLIVRGYYL